MEKLYYLREGDFLPEPIESICDSWHRSRKDMIDFLSKNNNLFTSKEEATRASCAIRSVLSAVTLPKCLLKVEGQVRQLCELTEIESRLASVFSVPSANETTTHMAVRLAADREIQGRKDYLCEFIATAITNEFKACGMLSKYPELHTSHNET